MSHGISAMTSVASHVRMYPLMMALRSVICGHRRGGVCQSKARVGPHSLEPPTQPRSPYFTQGTWEGCLYLQPYSLCSSSHSLCASLFAALNRAH